MHLKFKKDKKRTQVIKLNKHRIYYNHKRTDDAFSADKNRGKFIVVPLFGKQTVYVTKYLYKAVKNALKNGSTLSKDQVLQLGGVAKGFNQKLKVYRK